MYLLSQQLIDSLNFTKTGRMIFRAFLHDMNMSRDLLPNNVLQILKLFVLLHFMSGKDMSNLAHRFNDIVGQNSVVAKSLQIF